MLGLLKIASTRGMGSRWRVLTRRSPPMNEVLEDVKFEWGVLAEGLRPRKRSEK